MMYGMQYSQSKNYATILICRYEVLGGLHTLSAKTQLSVECPDNPFYKTTMAEVYVGLSDEEALRLARRHNSTSHFVHAVTHRDLVSTTIHSYAVMWHCVYMYFCMCLFV